MCFTEPDSIDGSVDPPGRRLGRVKIAHVRERNAPAGTPWRLAAARDSGHVRSAGSTSRRRAQGLVAEDRGAAQLGALPAADHLP